MISRRKMLIAVGSGALLAARPSFAQQSTVKTRRIGFIYAASRQSAVDSGRYGGFVRGMSELGYVEGKNLVVEWRFADGKYDRLPGFAVELVQLKVEVIVAAPSPSIRAAMQATSSIPIVFPSTGDPVGSGFVESLSRPGGNVTGLSNFDLDISAKLLEFLRTMIPKLARVAVLGNPGSSTESAILKSISSEAQKIGVQVVAVKARTPEEIEAGFATMKQSRVDAVIIALDALMAQQVRQIAQLAVRHRLPSITQATDYAAAGGLMSYGQNLTENFTRAAIYVDKILKGAKPGELPVEQPTKLSLIVNRKIATALGLSIPDAILLRAEKVID